MRVTERERMGVAYISWCVRVCVRECARARACVCVVGGGGMNE